MIDPQDNNSYENEHGASLGNDWNDGWGTSGSFCQTSSDASSLFSSSDYTTTTFGSNDW